ncbi:hypothetical protein OEZ85_000053 [Tetradesmus obliquus]|uniref:Uncharacterized protein n=1 Tax=Tetradesmus obliquus TaxID=3088 RepID=A0ABY8UUR0_TETOB|nr:hypothetical protein OEZ85_000053 [Tetradesmus obliquus]
MGPNNPNANSHTIRTYNGQNVEGCMIAGTSTCPAGYPIPLQSPSGGLAGCQKIGQNLTSCTPGQIPLYNAAGALQSCQAAATPCPAAFPDNGAGAPLHFAVTYRQLDMTCRQLDMVRHDGTCGITQCPAGYSLPTFGAFTTAPNNLTITNCFKDGSVASCSFINVVSGAVQSGAQGTYPTPILNSNNATIGCLQSNVPSCPSSAPFPLISYTPSGTSSRGTILSCSVALTSCNSTLIPAMTQGTLSACISFTANPAGGTTQFKCPSDYPVVVTNIDNPANVDAVSEILMCMSASSTCLASAPTSSPFTVTTSNTPSPQAFCVPVTGLTSCASYPASAYQSGVPIYAPNGVSLIGCTDVKTCPAPFFPVFFLDSSQPPNTVRCQASVAGSCPSAYPLPIIGANGALAGCSALSTNCTTGVIVAENATTSETVTCLAPGTTSCPAGTYSFPIYSGTRDANTGGATLVRCIRDPAAPDCNGAALSTYNIEVYGPTGTNVIGCVQASSAGTSYCPFGQPVAHMSQGSGTPTPFTLYQCRPAGSSCGAADSGLNFTIPIRNVPQINNAIVGCLASTATTCPGADGTVQIPNAGSAPLFAPFFVLGSGTPSLVECRQVASPPALPGPGTTCTQFLGPSTIYTIATTNAAATLASLSGCPAADLLPVNGTFNYPIATATAFPDAIVPANAIAVGDASTAARYAKSGLALCLSRWYRCSAAVLGLIAQRKVHDCKSNCRALLPLCSYAVLRFHCVP